MLGENDKDIFVPRVGKELLPLPSLNRLSISNYHFAEVSEFVPFNYLNVDGLESLTVLGTKVETLLKSLVANQRYLNRSSRSWSLHSQSPKKYQDTATYFDF